jgi:hypothetical protein
MIVGECDGIVKRAASQSASQSADAVSSQQSAVRCQQRDPAAAGVPSLSLMAAMMMMNTMIMFDEHDDNV